MQIKLLASVGCLVMHDVEMILSKLFHILFVCCVLFNVEFAHSADATEKSTFRISSAPGSAGVFHYLRGRNHFLGFTPVEVSKQEFDGKEIAKVRLIKFGYQDELRDLVIDGSGASVVLERVSRPYIKKQGEVTARLSSCSVEIEKAVEDLIRKNISSRLAVQLPFVLAETGKRVEIRIMTTVLNNDDIRSIEKLGRKDKDESVAFVGRLVDPVVSQLINAFEKHECLGSVIMVAAYQDKGLKVDFTPYLDNWSQYTQQIVGDTKYTTIVYGTKVELYSSMVQTKKDKSFLFEYKLH